MFDINYIIFRHVEFFHLNVFLIVKENIEPYSVILNILFFKNGSFKNKII
jgi:hypothetical protein